MASKEAREAAARWAKLNSRSQQAANILRGSCDSAPIVQAFARFEAETLERAATFVEANVLAHSSHDDVPAYFQPRREGNRYGLEYVAAIRNLKDRS